MSCGEAALLRQIDVYRLRPKKIKDCKQSGYLRLGGFDVLRYGSESRPLWHRGSVHAAIKVWLDSAFDNGGVASA